MIAIVQDAQPLIDLILQNAMEKRAIQTQKDIHGDTGLHLASLIGSKESVEKLLAYGFDKGIQNNVKFYNLQLGETPLNIAEQENHIEIIPLLGGTVKKETKP